MLGAIIGDIVGSRFEFNNQKTKDFELFTSNSHFTDDTVMTIAIANSIMETENITKNSTSYNNEKYLELLKTIAIKNMQYFGRRYPNAGYGQFFSRWIKSEIPSPYNSYGNGACMRISPVSFFSNTEKKLYDMTQAITAVTHNHKEGLKGAYCTSFAIYAARQGLPKNTIEKIINEKYYNLNFSIDKIRANYSFDSTCQGSVPQAIKAFLESSSFEDTIRISVSLGGDSDTIAAIAGSIAEAYYGIPTDIKDKALNFLDNHLYSIYQAWQEFLKK